MKPLKASKHPHTEFNFQFSIFISKLKLFFVRGFTVSHVRMHIVLTHTHQLLVYYIYVLMSRKFISYVICVLCFTRTHTHVVYYVLSIIDQL